MRKKGAEVRAASLFFNFSKGKNFNGFEMLLPVMMQKAFVLRIGSDSNLICCLMLSAAILALIPLGCCELSTKNETYFSDNFEGPLNWNYTEELVSECYRKDIGNISLSHEYPYNNCSRSVCVWANKNLTNWSNHMNAGNRVYGKSKRGNWSYSISALIDSNNTKTGQTGPEFSMQNTNASNFTHTAGIQYCANDQDLTNYTRWNIWTENASGGADWRNFTVQGIEAGKWYDLELAADFNSNRYINFSLREHESGEIIINKSLSDFKIVPEMKTTEDGKNFTEAFEITLESENKWIDCNSSEIDNNINYTYRVFYDNVILQKLADK